ncbi:trypsin-like peptidase domain-containing protein [Streptomyces sp. NBC_01518]|uniref:VMAP-C domain-containing protein n=1 Tax=Streptomyces sp. NBC_01518 TaxID=2903891 RepID=UPI0038678AC3
MPEGDEHRLGEEQRRHLEERLGGLVQDATVKIHAPVAAGATREPDIWGSGFFVAPNRVLTCAHVLSGTVGGRRVWRGDAEIGVTHRLPGGAGEATVTGRLLHCLPGVDEVPEGRRGLWPTPDLAVVELTEPAEHTCVWLSDLSTPPSDSSGRLLYRGFTRDEYGAVTDWEGYCQVAGLHARYLLRLTGHGGVIRSGLSGGPVVDLGRGAVVGVIKSRRNDQDGGNGVRVTALRELRSAGTDGRDPYQELILAHDRWHWQAQQRHGADAHTWASVQSQLLNLGRQWRPLDRVHALGLLAELPHAPDVGTVDGLVDAVAPRQRTSRMELPGAWRDGAGLLYDPFDGREEKAVLGYLIRVARSQRRAAPGPADELLTWAAERALSLPEDERAELVQLAERDRTRSETVHARVRPPADTPEPSGESTDDTFGPRGRPGTRLPRPDPRPRPPGPAPEQDPAPDEASVAVLLEFRGDWWLEGLYSWTIRLVSRTGDVELMAVGQDVPVAALDPAPPQDLSDALREVFLRADAGDRVAALRLVLPPELFDIPMDEWMLSRSSRHESNWLGAVRTVTVVDQLSHGRPRRPVARWTRTDEAEPPRAVPLLGDVPADVPLPVLYHCGPVGAGPAAGALRRVLDAGPAVVLWRRGGAGPEMRERFAVEVRRLVAGLRDLSELPDAVASLRAGSGESPGRDPAGHWAHGIALLYDDPDDPVLRHAVTGDLLDTP